MKANLNELKGLKRWYGDQPDRVRRAAGMMLNDFAFGTRTQAIKTINDSMTVRKEKFVSGRVQVKKANINKPVSRQMSVTGSARKVKSKKNGAFSGWEEQEYGKGPVRNRYQTMAARNNQEKKQVRPIVRLKPGRKVLKKSDYGMTGKHTAGQFLAAAKRKKENRLVRIGGVIFKRRRKEFEPVQILSKPKRTRRLKWMLMSRNRYFQKTNLDKLWYKYYTATLRPPPKR